MNIIDQIKESPADSAVIARFENLVRAGLLSEKQVAYGKSLIRAAAPKVSDEARAISERITASRRAARAAKPKTTKAAAPAFTIGQTVTFSGGEGIVTDVQGAGNTALLTITDTNGQTRKVGARYAKEA